MKLLDVLTSPWAIQPDKLLELQAIYATHMRGEKIDLKAVEARLGRPLANEPQPYTIVDGVAVLPIEGVIAKRANLFMDISGGVSTELVGRDLRAALNDPAVHSVILSIDSPGGTVDGTQSLADLVMQGREIKPIVTLASGLMASAAYWIGSAALKSYIVDGTTGVGSIGVVASHTDVSVAQAQRGIKTTEIYAGQFKRIASNYAPLSDAGRASIQDQVDYLYSLFVGAVAKQRGVSESKVLKDMADGRVFVGQQAIDAGLVDGVSTLDQLVAQLNQERAGVALAKPPTSKGAKMPQTREQILAESPEAAAALQAEGAAAERTRIQGIEAQTIAGHENVISAMKFDGKSTPADAAMAVNAAVRTAQTAQAAALAKDAPAPVASVATPAVPTPEKRELSRSELDAKAKAYVAAHPGTSYVAAVQLVQSQGA